MFFAQIKSVLRSLRFRLMLWNAVVMLFASLGALWGLREGVRYTLLSELDDNLHDDFREVSLALVKRVGIRLPLIAARRAKNRITDPPPAPARLAAIAIGLPADELITRLRALARERGVDPHRLLAITDSLEFTALRRAGFAFEYVPSPERAAAISDEPYPRFAERRIRAILAGRRRVPWTTVAAP